VRKKLTPEKPISVKIPANTNDSFFVVAAFNVVGLSFGNHLSHHSLVQNGIDAQFKPTGVYRCT